MILIGDAAAALRPPDRETVSPRLRLILIGDAAAALRPHVAAGTAKACADGWALRDYLLSAGD